MYVDKVEISGTLIIMRYRSKLVEICLITWARDPLSR